MNKLTEGEIAPNFEGLSLKKGKVEFYKLLKENKYTVLYFYPKDDTLGCTKEACNFRDNISKIKDLGASVIGVSLDDIDSHKRFSEKYNLNFDLISDINGEIAEKYGVLKSMFGKKFASRVTFIIDSEGKIIKIFKKVNPSNHAEEVINFLKSLNK